MFGAGRGSTETCDKVLDIICKVNCYSLGTRNGLDERSEGMNVLS